VIVPVTTLFTAGMAAVPYGFALDQPIRAGSVATRGRATTA
jgi:hypothetical protein